MSDPNAVPKDQRGGLRFDKTISIPTLVAVVSAVVPLWWWSTSLYAELRIADRENAQEIRTLKSDVTRIEKAQSDQVSSMKSDLRDINAKLDRLTDRLLITPDVKGWTRP
ncbi:hypothetical protein AH2_00044 [Burkholderia phage vB_BceS_AH2]|uniref:Uncharacterized protein n=1 Tax=Burkholderia phage vB_BceS_AH2 TaxID=1133022 RepID=I6NP92_9CAUD|nr:Rz-like spanin [Burkholderia phage vB_BceS_AH2]AEY69553.1 hypothetical protein AH2_00044 [Burkholderia phage vB_BceS_AH2]